MGLEWVGATRLGAQTLAEQNKDIQPDDMGYGTSFGFRLPGHFFSPADEVKPALFVPLWGFLGEVSQRCKYVGSVGRPGGAWGCGAGARGRTPGHPPSQVGPLDSFNTVGDMWMLLYVFLTTVVLVNLLVAMMADTYSRVRENSQIEALAARYRRSAPAGMPTMGYRVLIA